MILALACIVIDGDTLRCDGERIRLLGIDAPELHACPKRRTCAPGDGKVSKGSLERQLSANIGQLKIERVGFDRYGRTLAVVTVGGVNLSCQQIKDGQAVYVAKWDNQQRIAKVCPQ